MGCEEVRKYFSEIGDGIQATPLCVASFKFYFINANNLIENKIKIANTTKCISKEYKKYKKDLNERTILLSINGTIGNTAFFYDEQVLLGKSAAYINIKKHINKQYIFYLLQSHGVNSDFEYELTGTTIRNLSLSSIQNTPIPLLYTVEEQKAIAQSLSDINVLIAACDRAPKSATSSKARCSNSSRAKRLSGYGKGQSYKQTEIGEIPED